MRMVELPRRESDHWQIQRVPLGEIYFEFEDASLVSALVHKYNPVPALS